MSKVKTAVLGVVAVVIAALGVMVASTPAHALDTKQDTWTGDSLMGSPKVTMKGFFSRQADGTGFYVHGINLFCGPAGLFGSPATNGHELKIVNDNFQTVWRRTDASDIPGDCDKYLDVKETFGATEFLIFRYEFTPKLPPWDVSRKSVQFTIENNR